MYWCDTCEHFLKDDDVQFVNPGTSEDSEGIGYCTYCESEVETYEEDPSWADDIEDSYEIWADWREI